MWSMQYLRGAEGIHVPVRLPSSTLETEGCIICFNWRAFVWCGFRVAATPGLVVAIMVWTYPIMVCFILTGVVTVGQGGFKVHACWNGWNFFGLLVVVLQWLMDNLRTKI